MRADRTLLLRCGASALALSLVLAGAPALAQSSAGPAGAPSGTQPQPPAAIDDGTQAQVTDVTADEEDAPQDDAAEVEAVVVTGIRSSLRSSQAIKRNADVFVDSVTSEDIGALPDRSVTEALQRIPGVAISRFAAGVDPDHFSVEGSGAVVRGLTYVRSEINGREAFTANNGRALGFSDVPSELMGGVDVFKNQSADMIEGGIAGTVNLRTRVPFDSAGRLIAGSLEASYGDFAEEWAPTGSLLVSDRFDTGAGEFGVLFNVVSSQLKSRADGTQVSNFGRRTDLGPNAVFFPRGAAFRSQTFDRERTGFGAAAQWRSPDRTMLATLQFLRSEASQAWTEHAVEIATDNVTSNGDSRPVLGTAFEFGGGGVFTRGQITGPTGWRSDQPCCGGVDNRTPSFGLQSNNQRRDVDQDYLTQDIGFNLKWTPNDNLSVNFDIQHVDSEVQVLDATTWASTYQNLDLRMNGSEPPVFFFTPPTQGPGGAPTACPGGLRAPGAPDCPRYYQPGHASFSDPFNSFWRNNMDHIEDSEGTLDAVRLDADYKFDENIAGGWIDSVRFGARWAQRDQTARFSTYNWGVLSEQWGEGGPVWLDDPVDGIPNPNGSPVGGGTPTAGLAYTFPFDNFFRGEVPVPTGDQPRLFYGQNITENYAAYSQFGLRVGDEWRARNGANGCPQNWVPLAMRCGVVAGTPFLPQEINPATEDTQSLYVMVRYGLDDIGNGWKISGNFGLRWFQTERQSEGIAAFQQGTFPSEATCAAVPAGQTPPAFCTLTPQVRAEARAFANGATLENSRGITYDYLLPSFNLKLELNPEMLLRFGFSKSITPPDLGLTRNYYNIALSANTQDIVDGRPTARTTVGNPLLLPITSTNFDASYEWYFADAGSFTFAAFYKELEDVLTNSTVRQPFTNNGATFDILLTTPVNAQDTGTIKGFEVAYQQFYDFLPGFLSDFGINANYTYIDAQGVEQSTLSATDPDVGAGRVANVNTSLLPLQGLSKHNANLALIYETDRLSARLAYSWRSEFLLTVRDVIVPFAPIMNEDTGQLDGSIFYTINENYKIGVQAVNLTNEVTRTTQVLNNDLLRVGRSWFMNDRRFTAVLRATF